MSERLQSSIDDAALAQALTSTMSSAQSPRAQRAAAQSPPIAQSPSTRLRPLLLSPRSTSEDSGFSSPSEYPLPSPGFDHDASRPESSAQGAARYAANVQEYLSSRPRYNAFSNPSSPRSPVAAPRTIDHTHDTFGRTSGQSAISDPQGSIAARRKAPSPTGRSAIGYITSSSPHSDASDHNGETTEYLNQDSAGGYRQQKMDALEKALNLSNPSSPATATSSLAEDDTRYAGVSSSSLLSAVPRQRSQPSSLRAGGVGDTPNRTFGGQSRKRSQSNTQSGDSRPSASDDGTRPSRSDTTSSHDTYHSTRAAYGVGEAGGDEQFAALIRTLSPEQRRQQEELGRMSQQRDVASSASNSTGLTSQIALASPNPTKSSQRASHQSNATIMAAGTSNLATLTPGHDARLSRQTHETTSTEKARSPVSPQSHDDVPAFGNNPLFQGSQDSMDRLTDQLSPPLPQGVEGPLPTRSASVRVNTPMFGNTLAELPPGHRASVKGALHERGAVPDLSPGSLNGGSANTHSGSEPRFDQVHYVPPSSGQAHQAEHNVPPSQSHADERQQWWRARNSQPQETSDFYHQQPAQMDGPETAVDHAYTAAALGDVTKTPQLPNLGDAYAVAPKFPSAPYSQYRGLRLPSRAARFHHTILPLLTYAHIPATLFLDYNVIFALVQIALYPDNLQQSGTRAAWWISLGIYAACVAIWLVGVVVVYEGVWSYARRWTVQQPLVMPIYLSSPAFTRTAMKDYALYSLLYRAHASANRRDSLIESFWYYSQNWPTVLTLIPRGVISLIVLVIYRPSGPRLTTQAARDAAYFDRDTQRLSQFAFILIIIQAGWAAWKLGVLLIANIGLAATLGFKSLIQQEQDWNAFATNQMTGFTGYGRSGIEAQHIGPQAAKGRAWSHDGDVINEASQRRWAWRWRAEDRIRAILFDQGLLHHASPSQIWNHEQKQNPEEEQAGQNAFQSSQGHPTAYETATGHGHRQSDPAQDWTGAEMPVSESQTGLAITAHEAIQPETWAASIHPGSSTFSPAMPASQSLHVQHFETSPSDQGGQHSDASDPYSPAPLPVGRIPRPRQQMRDAASTASSHEYALNAEPSGSHVGSPWADQVGMTPLPVHQSRDETYNSPARRRDALGLHQDGNVLSPHNPPSSIPGPPPAAPPVAPLQLSNDRGLLSEWRGRKRPRSSPVINFFPPLDPGGMVSETEDWLQHEIDEDPEEEIEPDERPEAGPSSTKPMSFENDRRIMHAFVPMPASFAMTKDPSGTGSPDQGGSDTKHTSWTAAAPNPELFAAKPGSAVAPYGLRPDSEVPNSSTTSLGSLLKGQPLWRCCQRSSGDWLGMQSSDLTPRAERDAQLEDGLPTVITTSASTSLPYLNSGDVLHHESEVDGAEQDRGEPQSSLLAPAGAGQHASRRSASPTRSYGSNSSAGTDDSEEARLWASFPEQSRRHPPGLIALDLEQRSLAERRLAAAALEQNAAIQQQRLLYGNAGTTSVSGPAMNLSPLMHPNILAALGGSPMGLPGISPSEGGLHAIREESWTSSLDSRSQGAMGSTRSRGTASAVTASPIDANFPIEQLEEVAVPHRPSNGSLGGSRYGQRGGTN